MIFSQFQILDEDDELLDCVPDELDELVLLVVAEEAGLLACDGLLTRLEPTASVTLRDIFLLSLDDDEE